MAQWQRTRVTCGRYRTGRKKKGRHFLFNDVVQTILFTILWCQTCGKGLHGLLFSIVWGAGELFTCPYPLKVQACLPRDHRLVFLSRVLGWRSFPISSKESFICIICKTGQHIQWPFLHQLWSTGWNEKSLNEPTMKDRSNNLG